jgi:hypothetical protein
VRKSVLVRRLRLAEEEIDKLRTQIESPFTEVGYFNTSYAPTLAGRLDAVIKHLGVNIEVEQKKTTGPSYKVKKVKAKGKK